MFVGQLQSNVPALQSQVNSHPPIIEGKSLANSPRSPHSIFSVSPWAWSQTLAWTPGSPLAEEHHGSGPSRTYRSTSSSDHICEFLAQGWRSTKKYRFTNMLDFFSDFLHSTFRCSTKIDWWVKKFGSNSSAKLLIEIRPPIVGAATPKVCPAIEAPPELMSMLREKPPYRQPTLFRWLKSSWWL